MSISLEKSVRTCSVNVGEANRIQSDRFQNPGNMVCIPWNGLNNQGQEVSPDSFYTKTPGCDSAEDRVMVENAQRPKYYSYVTLGAQGLNGDIYGRSDQDSFMNVMARDEFDKSRNKNDWYGGSGNFGKQWGSNVAYQGCTVDKSSGGSYDRYQRGAAQIAQAGRAQNFMQNGYKANNNMRMAGNY
jgi:hypothetical protein